MSDFEQQLRRRLMGRAATVAPEGDLADLVERIAKQRARGRRASAFVMALVVVVGPIAGFGIARATDGTGARSAATRGRATSSTAPKAKTKFSATPLPAVKPSSQGPFSEAPGGAADVCVDSVVCALNSSGQQLDLGRMFARTSSDGVALRVYGAALPAPPSTVPWFTPAPWCSPNRLVQVDSSNELVAGTTQGYLYEKPQNDLAASVSLVGTNEGAPVWVAIVQSDEGTTARATFADGGSDSLALADGVAVLAHGIAKPGDLETLDGEALDVQILDAGGAVVGDTTVHANGSPAFGNGGDSDPADCTAPAKLPAPGSEQPTDVAAATAGVTQAYVDVYTGSNSDAVKDAAIDDLAGVDAARAELRSGPDADEAKVATANVTDVVFLSATKAAVSYDIDIPGYSNFTGRFGEAVFTGGRWKVTRETFCGDIAMAGVTCSP
jgi:hypothetical protein